MTNNNCLDYSITAFFFWILLLTYPCTKVSALQSNAIKSPQSLTETICAGRPRLQCEVEVDVPQACVPEGNSDPSCPIVFFFHGAGGNNNGFAGTSTVHDAGYIGVYPQGEKGWNTGPKSHNNCPWTDFDCTEDPDEGDYIASIIAELRSQGASGNIYAIGNSNGAALAHRLASNAGDELPIKGIVAKVTQLLASPERSGPGSLNYNQPRSGSPAVSVLSIMGTNDPLIPYDGGSSGVFGGDDAFQLMPSLDSMNAWANHNGCDGTLTVDDTYVTNQGTGKATKYDYSAGCPSGIVLEHYAIHGGGHGAGGASINNEKINYIIAFDFINRVENGNIEPPQILQPKIRSTAEPSVPPNVPPSSSSCVDDESWAGKVNPAHTCDYVAQNPEQRCNWESSDGTLASTACLKTCGECSGSNTSVPTAEPSVPPNLPSSSSSFVDSPDWHGKFNVAHTCDYVAQNPGQRCKWESSDGTLASAACLKTCGDSSRRNLRGSI